MYNKVAALTRKRLKGCTPFGYVLFRLPFSPESLPLHVFGLPGRKRILLQYSTFLVNTSFKRFYNH